MVHSLKPATLLIALAVCIIFADTSEAQQVTLDHLSGTIEVNGHQALMADGITRPTFFIRVTVLDGSGFPPMSGAVHGFRVYSPDGAVWNAITPDTMPLGWRSFFDLGNWIHHDLTPGGPVSDTIGFGHTTMMRTGFPALFNDVTYQIALGPIDVSQDGRTICLDSSFFQPAGIWLWANPSGSVPPSWDGPNCFEIARNNCCVGNAGDVNGDGFEGDVSDIVYLVKYAITVPPGPPPPCPAMADVNGDGTPGDVADVVYLVEYAFGAPPGPPPQACR